MYSNLLPLIYIKKKQEEIYLTKIIIKTNKYQVY